MDSGGYRPGAAGGSEEGPPRARLLPCHPTFCPGNHKMRPGKYRAHATEYRLAWPSKPPRSAAATPIPLLRAIQHNVMAAFCKNLFRTIRMRYAITFRERSLGASTLSATARGAFTIGVNPKPRGAQVAFQLFACAKSHATAPVLC